MKVSNTLQQLVFGDRNIFIFVNEEGSEDIINVKSVFKVIMSLNKAGFGVSNPDIMFNWSSYELNKFSKEFTELSQNNTKEGAIFRKTFAESEEFSDYTEEEWMAIFAQYAITYGWQDKYTSATGKFAENVLIDYTNSLDFEMQNELSNNNLKMFTIIRGKNNENI